MPRNASFPLQVDEIVHPRYVGDSFLKLLIPARRDSTSSPPEASLGEHYCAIAILLRNVGDASLTFKVAAALRVHAAEDQAGGSAYEDMSGFSGVNAVTIVAGGYVNLLIPVVAKNLFAFILTAGGPTSIKAEASSQNPDLTVWKALERETEKGDHLDTFLDDDSPKIFYSNSSPSSE